RRARREECGSPWGPQFTGDRTRRADAKRSGRGGGGVRGAGERAAALLLETRAVGGMEREVTAHAAGDGVREARLLAGAAQAALLGGIGNIGGLDEHRGNGARLQHHEAGALHLRLAYFTHAFERAHHPLRGAGTDADDLVLRLLDRSEEHTSELQSRGQLVCRLLLEKKKQLGGAVSS